MGITSIVIIASESPNHCLRHEPSPSVKPQSSSIIVTEVEKPYVFVWRNLFRI